MEPKKSIVVFSMFLQHQLQQLQIQIVGVMQNGFGKKKL